MSICAGFTSTTPSKRRSTRAGQFVCLLVLAASGSNWAQPFAHRTQAAGLAALARTNGVAVADYDGDDDLDIYFVVHDSYQSNNTKTWNRLYANNGNGTFADVTARAGLAGRNGNLMQNPNGMGNKMGAAWGDYDNDGRPDMVLTHYGSVQLFHNNGDGTFADVTNAAGLSIRNTQLSSSALWFDYDRDGDLDLYISIYAEFFRQPNERGNKLYENLGEGKFLDVSTATGTADNGATWTTIAFDADNDGHLDLYLANDFGPNRFYLNAGNKTFLEKTAAYGLEDSFHGMGLAVADCDGNGYFDVYLTNIADPGNGPESNPLFLNTGQNRFINKAAELGIARPGWGWGTAFFDLENDGDEDLLVVTGNFLPNYRNVLFENISERGAFRFEDIAARAGVADSTVARGAAIFDYDQDGDHELLISNFYAAPALYENTQAHGNWLAVSLEGTASNRTAFGTVVEVQVRGRSYKKYHHGAQFLGQSIIPLHFGLGDALETERIIIKWPRGLVEEIGAVGMNKTIHVKEGEGVVSGVRQSPAGPATPPEMLRLMGNSPNPFKHETQIRFELRVSGEVEISITDLHGRTIRTLKENYAAPGEKAVHWNGTDWNMQPVSSGFYFYRLKINGSAAGPEVGKMLCIK